MGATWTVLGAGAILPRSGYGPSGYALRPEPGAGVTLFDCGPGTLRNLPSAGIELGEVERIVLSHFHLDHCLDLFAFAFARRNPDFAPAPTLELIGPRGLAQLLEDARALGPYAVDPRAQLVEVEVAGGQPALARSGLRLTWCPTGHTSNALAWRVDLEGGPSVTYSGDSPEEPAVADLAADCDLFVCECSHADGSGVPGHLTPASAARLAARAGTGRLLLTHFYPGLDPELARAQAAEVYDGPIELARDGLRLELTNA